MTSRSAAAATSDLPIPLAAFNRWLLRAAPGDQLEYHRGFLICDRAPTSGLDGDERRALTRVTDAALRASTDGLVHLAQRRNGPFDFSYVAIKRPILKGMPAYGAVANAGQPARVAAAA